MRLIDADALINRVVFHTDWPSDEKEAFEDEVNSEPTVEPERKTGKWIYGEHQVAMCDGYYCDKCGFFVPWDYQHKFIDFIKDYHYCPNCGSYNGGDSNERT